MERYFPKFSKRLAGRQLHIRDHYFSRSTTAPTHLPRDITNNIVLLGSAAELSGLSPEMVSVLSGRPAGGHGPAAGVKKNKKKKEAKPGEGKSRFAVARREKKAAQEAAKKATKEAEPSSSSSTSTTAAAATTTPSSPSSAAAAEKKAAESAPAAAAAAAAAKTPAESKPEAAEPEATVDFVDCSLGEKADEEMTGA